MFKPKPKQKGGDIVRPEFRTIQELVEYVDQEAWKRAKEVLEKNGTSQS